jgi:gamma-glutamylcyclotransferase (GGCT)/AIG2-like uncharacterized protein YtfP
MGDEHRPEQQCEQLFVYGTLMSRFHNVHAVALRQAATLVGSATYRGMMHRVAGPRGDLIYPVVTPSDDDADVVHGELYRLNDRRILDRLDAYEGCAAECPQPHEYRRDLAEVTLESGVTTEAMLYVFQGTTTALPRITDGVFR